MHSQPRLCDGLYLLIERALAALLMLSTLVPLAACEDRQEQPETSKTSKTSKASEAERERSEPARQRSKAPSPTALAVAPPPRCAEGGYGIWPALARPSGAVDFCLYRPRGSACEPKPQPIWEPDPLELRPCLRFDPRTRRFSQRRDWPRRAPRYPRISVVDPLRVCAAADRCWRFPALRGLRRASLDPRGARVAVLYEQRRRSHLIDVYTLPTTSSARRSRGDAVARARRVTRIRAPAHPARVQLLGRHLAWFEAKSYGAARVHLHTLPDGKLLRSFGQGDPLQSELLLAPYAKLVHVEGDRWATLSLHGERLVIEDLARGVGRRIDLAAYYRHAVSDSKRRRTERLNQARLVSLPAVGGAPRLGVVFGDPVVGLAIVDARRGSVVDVLYGPCL